VIPLAIIPAPTDGRGFGHLRPAHAVHLPACEQAYNRRTLVDADFGIPRRRLTCQLPESPFYFTYALSLASDLETAWNAATTAMSAKQRLVRTLIQEIVVDVVDETREVILVVHWRGGHHSELRVKKPSPGEHTKSASPEADAIICDMATRYSDEHIAAMLNRMRLTTGQGLSMPGSAELDRESRRAIPMIHRPRDSV
jgi:hypothetical protein